MTSGGNGKVSTDVRMPRAWVWLVASATIAGCGGVSGLDPVSSHAVDLSGSWILNRQASDDPQKLLDKLRPKMTTHRDTGIMEDNDSDSGPQQGGTGQRGRRSQQIPIQQLSRNNQVITHTQVMRALSADVARADQLTIRQKPDQMMFDYGTTARTFTPGSKSVVSASWGVADQSSGWSGKEFVIQVRPQAGVRSVESFSLSPDGKHLMEELHLGGGDYPSVELKRVYDHTDNPLPRALPTND